MSFNQWAAGKALDTSVRLELEAVWNAITRGPHKPDEASLLLNDLLLELEEASD